MNYHQGDVFLLKIKEIPKGAELVRKDIVAYGEITGHKHSIVDSLFYKKDGKSYLRIKNENSKMTHDDHPTLEKVDCGDYEVRIQQEYFPDGFKNVSD